MIKSILIKQKKKENIFDYSNEWERNKKSILQKENSFIYRGVRYDEFVLSHQPHQKEEEKRKSL